jgi:hypothetical protein
VRFLGGSGLKLCVFQVEVAEQRAFFRWKCVFQVDVAEKRVFFRWKWLKNVHFSGGSV